MATTFKNFLSNDLANTRTLLHEAIPVTGTIASGTYLEGTTETNIKEYGHGMFQSIYDYPHLSSSANHIFDVTFGYHSASALRLAGLTANEQDSKKQNIYNQMAQTLVGYDTTGSIKHFTTSEGIEINDAIFINFARLLTKDELKKGSFTIDLYTGSTVATVMNPNTITDTSGASGYRVDSPAGEYGYLYSADGYERGILYYQAGIAILSGGSVFDGAFGNGGGITEAEAEDSTSFATLATASTISAVASGLRNRLNNLSFNNTTELNSTIYFCRVNHSDFNYSSNPTYLTGSKLRVKTMAADAPVSYLTTIGLYSADNELLAVAKLSEPLRKSSDTELTLRVRLDY
jgi:hypothetical protein